MTPPIAKIQRQCTHRLFLAGQDLQCPIGFFGQQQGLLTLSWLVFDPTKHHEVVSVRVIFFFLTPSCNAARSAAYVHTVAMGSSLIVAQTCKEFCSIGNCGSRDSISGASLPCGCARLPRTRRTHRWSPLSLPCQWPAALLRMLNGQFDIAYGLRRELLVTPPAWAGLMMEPAGRVFEERPVVCGETTKACLTLGRAAPVLEEARLWPISHRTPCP